MSKSALLINKLTKCSFCMKYKVIWEKIMMPSMTRHLASVHSFHGSLSPHSFNKQKCASLQKESIHSHGHMQCVKHRLYCTKDFDMENDPEARSLLNEIILDFDSAKKSEKGDSQVEHLTDETENTFTEEKTEKENSNNNQTNYHSVQSEIEDVEDFEEHYIEPAWIPPVSLTRGKSGVFELEELVTLLESENGQNIAVIEIPKEARFADHMVIVSAQSIRHLRSMSSRVKWIHKQRKGEHDTSLKVEGFDTAPDWHAMDLGNIILHLFLPETREVYDLETLWTNWGKPGQIEKEEDPYTISPEDDFWRELEPQHENTDKTDPK